MREAIRVQVATIHGIDPAGSVNRCPGDTCPRWAAAAGSTYEDKVREIRNCQKCGGNAPLEAQDPDEVEADEGELARLVAIIEDLVAEYDAGRPFNPEDLEPWEWAGVVTWRRYSDLYTKAQAARLASLLSGATRTN